METYEQQVHLTTENSTVFLAGEGGGVLPIMTYTGRFYPKGVPFSCRLRVYERVRISLVEVYERVGISDISIGEKT